MRNLLKITRNFLLVCLFAGISSACSPKLPLSSDTKTPPGPADPQSNVTLNDVLKGNKLIAFNNKNALFLVDPEYAKPVQVYIFKEGEQPADTSSSRFIISPSKEWVVWYSPQKGVLALHIRKELVNNIHEPSVFLNTYPYLEFVPNEDTVAFITDNGNTFQRYSLDSQTTDSVKIPYPYGNVFKISPDNQLLLFVSGYGQTKEKPEYMLTDNRGTFLKRFSTNTNLSERNFVQWSPDSNGIVISHDNKLLYYPVTAPDSPTSVVSYDSKERIIASQFISSQIFIQTSEGYWHVYSFPDWKEVARTPVAIAGELHTPKFIPWGDKQFLIEETLVDDPDTFNRLWQSDFRGTKKIVVQRYNELILQTKLQVVD